MGRCGTSARGVFAGDKGPDVKFIMDTDGGETGLLFMITDRTEDNAAGCAGPILPAFG